MSARAASTALDGFGLGASLGLLLHLSNLAANAGVADDAASRRVAAELVRLGAEKAAFVAALAIAVALVAGLVGAAVSLLLRWALPSLTRGGRAAFSALGTGVVLVLLVLRAFLRQPALLEPSLGGARGALAPLLARLTALPYFAVDALLAGAVLVALVVGARRRTTSFGRRARILVGLAALLALGWTVSHRLRPRPGATLLVLAADSLRPDHFSTETAPRMQALMARGVSFDLALSPMASTTPAWVSLLSGRYPQSHGVRHMFPRRELRADWLDYLPRRLSQAGYRTSVVSDYAGDFFPLFDFGFDVQRVSPPLTLGLVFQREVLTRSSLALALLNHRAGHAAFPAFRFLMTNADPERLADEVLDELRASAGRKSVVVAFFSTTHVPFAAPWPWYRRFADPRYGGTHRYLYDVQRLADVTASDVGQPARDVAQIRRLYDGALAATDAAIGRILDSVDENTTIVLVSDHGENLFEPGTTTFHGKWFRGGDEANRVPLAIAGPEIPRGVRVPEPVSLVDLAPTIAELLHLPPADSDGASLVPAFSGHAAPRDVLAETAVWLGGPATDDGVRYPPLPELLEADPRDRFQLVLKTRYEDVVVEAKHRMLRRGPWKLLYIPTAGGVRWQLFDMSADPHQQHDLAASSPELPALARALKKALARDPERELDARDHLVRRSD
jgi:arylsulfatase A-like enzyme